MVKKKDNGVLYVPPGIFNTKISASSPHNSFMYFVFLSRKTAIIFPNRIN